MFGWEWKNWEIEKVSLYKFTRIPLLKNDAQLKPKKWPKKEKRKKEEEEEAANACPINQKKKEKKEEEEEAGHV